MTPAAQTACLRRLHARGATDRQLARRLGISYLAAWRRRTQAGLPCNRNPEQHRAACRRAAQRRIERTARGKCLSLGECYAGFLRLEAALRGWYGADSPAQCDLLDHLMQHGPQTMRQLVAGLGYAAMPSLAGGNSTLYRLVGKLKRAGLLRKVGVVDREPKYMAVLVMVEEGEAGE